MTFRSLICEEHSNNDGKLESFVSIGRVSFWIFLTFMGYFWMTDKVVPETLYHSWVSILIYNLAKKAFSLAGEKLAATIK